MTDCRVRITLPPIRSMVICVPELTGYAGVGRVAASLPSAAQLIDGTKYMARALDWLRGPPVRRVRYICWTAQADRSRAAPIAARDARLADDDQPRPFI